MFAMAGLQTSSKRKKDAISLKLILLFIVFGICCFYAGIIVGANSMTAEKVCQGYMSEVDRQAQKIGDLKKELFDRRFPDTVGHIAKGMALVPRDDFAQRFDMGVPLDPSDAMNEDVLVLYSHSAALPSDKTVSMEVQSNHPMPRLDVEAATENCDTLNVILAAPKDLGQCFAIMGQYRSYHIQKFMRLPEKEGEELNRKLPLRYVNRGAQATGRGIAHRHPSQQQTLEYWEILKNYLNSLDTVLERLRPKAAEVAQNHNNTVTVMVSNFGQSELLFNWFCAARARGLDTSAVLVFATDEETRDLADAIGVNVFYDNITYGNMPKAAAKRYADDTFTQMMMAKVYCVQQVMMLGHNVFFQDVDVVWYKDPLKYFHHDPSPHDMYFQDDGSRGLFYAPYSANTGVYYVRNNGRTRYFFNSLLMAGDLIMSTHSHQITLVALLSEHASAHGLRIKVLSRDTEEFPGGYAFHNRPEYMKQLMQGEVKPYLFHMSWTANKVNKKRFLKQTGNWYLSEHCEALSFTDTLFQAGYNGDPKNVPHGAIANGCCPRNQPFYTCFYKDKPSLEPCPKHPSLDDNDKSFW